MASLLDRTDDRIRADMLYLSQLKQDTELFLADVQGGRKYIPANKVQEMVDNIIFYNQKIVEYQTELARREQARAQTIYPSNPSVAALITSPCASRLVAETPQGQVIPDVQKASGSSSSLESSADNGPKIALLESLIRSIKEQEILFSGRFATAVGNKDHMNEVLAIVERLPRNLSDLSDDELDGHIKNLQRCVGENRDRIIELNKSNLEMGIREESPKVSSSSSSISLPDQSSERLFKRAEDFISGNIQKVAALVSKGLDRISPPKRRPVSPSGSLDEKKFIEKKEKDVVQQESCLPRTLSPEEQLKQEGEIDCLKRIATKDGMCFYANEPTVGGKIGKLKSRISETEEMLVGARHSKDIKKIAEFELELKIWNSELTKIARLYPQDARLAGEGRRIPWTADRDRFVRPPADRSEIIQDIVRDVRQIKDDRKVLRACAFLMALYQVSESEKQTIITQLRKEPRYHHRGIPYLTNALILPYSLLPEHVQLKEEDFFVDAMNEGGPTFSADIVSNLRVKRQRAAEERRELAEEMERIRKGIVGSSSRNIG